MRAPTTRMPLRARFLLTAAAPSSTSSSSSSSSALSAGTDAAHTTHVAPALLHALEEFAVYAIDLATLMGDASAHRPEVPCVLNVCPPSIAQTRSEV
jgi:hypothetical protein